MKKRNIFFSLMIAFLFATTFSAALSYSASYYLNMQTVVKDVSSDEKNICKNFIEISKAFDIKPEILAQRLSNSMYILKVLDEKDIQNISKENIELLSNGEIITNSEFMDFDTECLFKSGDNIIKIYLNKKNNVIRSYSNRMGLILSMTLLLSAVIMFCAGKSMTKPLQELCMATKKVAKGDFNVQVDVEGGTEISTLAESFNKMVNELKSNELLKKDFISNVSHEFKTPLATVNGFAKLLKNGNCTEEEASEYIEIIEHETERLSTLCGNILKLSKIENQKIVTKPVLFRLDEQIRDSLLILEPQWSEKEIELEVNLDEINYYGDEELLQQVWLNIIGNAVKFTDNKGKIEVTLTEGSENSIIITISDNGIGMSEETQKHIFEKFYQGDTSHSTLGNGLGLALVSEIVNLCGGKIKLSSALGQGSTFTVILPINEIEE